MLLMKDLIADIDSKYEPMLRKVSIADFTKCVAQFSGLAIQEVSDKMIKEYLHKWARNKYKFFEMLGNKTQLDKPIVYKNNRADIEEDIETLSNEYPGYGLWLNCFRGVRQNKISRYDLSLDYSAENFVRRHFQHYALEGSTMTHFFKTCLKAPDELVTAIGRIFENDTISATYTISIDPVDIMTASENPYNWQSCYRLAIDNEDSHADGCMAALLDTSSLITYIWTNEGKMALYDFDLKKVRYKRIRGWIAIEPEHFGAIHFNTLYPGKQNYDEEFEKQLRVIVEKVVADYCGFKDRWTREHYCRVWREYFYGYGEYEDMYIYRQIDAEDVSWQVFNEPIYCPCGCERILPGSNVDDCDYYEEDNYKYNGQGFTRENFDYQYYCEVTDGYCSCECCRENCSDCYDWQQAHPMCELDTNEECQDPEYYNTNNGIMHCDPDHCEGCPLYKQHHPEEEEEEEGHDNTQEEITEIDGRQLTHLTIDNNPVTFTTTASLYQEEWDDMINNLFKKQLNNEYHSEDIFVHLDNIDNN